MIASHKTSPNLFLSLSLFTARFKTFSILYHIFVKCLVFIFLDEQFLAYNIIIDINGYVILFRCIAKANLWGKVTVSSTCHIISELSASHTSDGRSPVSHCTGPWSISDRSIWFRDAKNLAG